MDDATDGPESTPEDPFCSLLGIEFRTVEPGYAEAEVTTTEELLNFSGTIHGGVVFALADAAAAAAENAKGRQTLGLETSTSFLSAVEPGQTLVACAESTHETGKTTHTSVEVTTSTGETVAAYMGRGYRV